MTRQALPDPLAPSQEVGELLKRFAREQGLGPEDLVWTFRAKRYRGQAIAESNLKLRASLPTDAAIYVAGGLPVRLDEASRVHLAGKPLVRKDTTEHKGLVLLDASGEAP